MGRIHYLDSNATTPLDPQVGEKMIPYLTERFANPSAIYTYAQEVRGEVEGAREKVARLINADPEEIIFTSGGTEADNQAVKGVVIALQNKGGHIITSQIEHHAVLNVCEYLEGIGYEVTYLPVDTYGIVDPADIARAIRDDTILITIMHGNNEIGTIEPIEEITRIAHKHDIYFHTDAVQTVGKLQIDVKAMDIDLLSLSGHKFHGPKGIGALYVRKGVQIDPLVHGGHHEWHRRAGTENVPGIIGLGKAAEIAHLEIAENERKVRSLRDTLERGIVERIPEVIITDAPYGILNRHILAPLGVDPSNLISTQPFPFIVLTNGFIGASFGMIVFTSAIESIPRIT